MAALKLQIAASGSPSIAYKNRRSKQNAAAMDVGVRCWGVGDIGEVVSLISEIVNGY